MARPGGNIAGLTNQLGDTAEKQLQTLEEMRPGLSRIALLWNPDDAGSTPGREGSIERVGLDKG